MLHSWWISFFPIITSWLFWFCRYRGWECVLVAEFPRVYMRPFASIHAYIQFFQRHNERTSFHQPAEMCALLRAKVDMSCRLIGCLGSHKKLAKWSKTKSFSSDNCGTSFFKLQQSFRFETMSYHGAVVKSTLSSARLALYWNTLTSIGCNATDFKNNVPISLNRNVMLVLLNHSMLVC